MKLVMAFGTFDILHEGHRFYIQQASRFGDRLLVIVARDETVKDVKGNLPRNSQDKRLEQVKTIDKVDEALLGATKDMYEHIRKYKPAVICLGYDQNSFSRDLPEKLISFGLKSKIIRLPPYKPHKYKSSKLK